ncbi:uncharacterized protein [Elaeis guineensis]|nr:uncharacterized protein LOC105060837 isoform X2 [Elaeis guineensis]
MKLSTKELEAAARKRKADAAEEKKTKKKKLILPPSPTAADDAAEAGAESTQSDPPVEKKEKREKRKEEVAPPSHDVGSSEAARIEPETIVIEPKVVVADVSPPQPDVPAEVEVVLESSSLPTEAGETAGDGPPNKDAAPPSNSGEPAVLHSRKLVPSASSVPRVDDVELAPPMNKDRLLGQSFDEADRNFCQKMAEGTFEAWGLLIQARRFKAEAERLRQDLSAANYSLTEAERKNASEKSRAEAAETKLKLVEDSFKLHRKNKEAEIICLQDQVTSAVEIKHRLVAEVSQLKSQLEEIPRLKEQLAFAKEEVSRSAAEAAAAKEEAARSAAKALEANKKSEKAAEEAIKSFKQSDTYKRQLCESSVTSFQKGVASYKREIARRFPNFDIVGSDFLPSSPESDDEDEEECNERGETGPSPP